MQVTPVCCLIQTKELLKSLAYYYEEAGQTLLELTYEQTENLFYLSRWPYPLFDRWHEATTPEQRRLVMAERIQLMLDKGK